MNEKCICGHKKDQHNLSQTECYTFRHVDGNTYQCVCKKYKEKKNDIN